MTAGEIAAIEDVIQSWKGAGIYIWSYVVAHRQLTLRMQRHGERENVHVVCTGCSYLQGKPVWSNSHLSFEKLTTSEPYAQYVLRDDAGQLRVVFTHATVERDVAPMHVA